MIKRFLVLPVLLWLSISCCMAQPAPAYSSIDIPVAIDLKPLYVFANKFVDTLYTSPNYPNGWVEDGCETRYQYRFVRGPMQFTASNDVLYVKFTGRYTVRGSTRICTGLGKTPWTPPCSCGAGDEAPRRVDAGFVAAINIRPDFSLDIKLQSITPRPLDKCVVCAFGIDITQTVVDQVKMELDASLKETAAMMQSVSLRPYVQQLWDTLQTGYPVPGFGRIVMNPQAVRISKLQLRRDSMYLSIGLSARPELSPVARPVKKPLPALGEFAYRQGFAVHVSQVLPYDSLDAMLNKTISGQEFTVGKGFLSKKIVIDSAHLTHADSAVRIIMYASKGVQATFSMVGIPTWDTAHSRLYFDKLDYDLAFNQRLLQNISSLFDKTILKKLQQYTTIELKEKTDDLKTTLNNMLNSELYEGVRSSGAINDLILTKLSAMDSGIFLSGYCNGKMNIMLNAEPFLKLMTK